MESYVNLLPKEGKDQEDEVIVREDEPHQGGTDQHHHRSLLQALLVGIHHKVSSQPHLEV